MDDENKKKEKRSLTNVARLAEAQRKKARTKDSEPPSANDDRPVIQMHKGRTHEALDEADRVLGEHDGSIFAQHARMVRITAIGEVQKLAGTLRHPGAVIIQPVVPAHLVDRLARCARFERYDTRASRWIPADVPKSLAESFLARAGDWRHVPPLTGVVEAPTLRPDGSVLDLPGYDRDSGLYFVGRVPDGYQAPPPQPTRKQASDALDLLWDAFREFPAVAHEDHAAMISGVLTVLLRRSLPSAPMIGITAPTAGTGKSKLVHAVATIAIGHKASVLSLGKDEAEGEKRLAAALLSGDPVINLDNIERPLFGDLLCQVLTESEVSLRPLGGSVEVKLRPNSAFLSTGNNLDIRGDLKRRILLVRLDAKMERPEQREFARDVVEVVAERRGELITACLTIVRAYLAAGSPAIKAAAYGGFEAWDAWCRRPLMWLDIPDPLLSSEEVRAEDPDVVLQRMLFAAWDTAFGSEKVTASDVAQRAVESTKGVDGQSTHDNPELYEAVIAACGEKITAKRLGYWLRRHQMRVCDGYRIERAGFDVHSKISQWILVKLSG